jgi:DNA repair protein RecN (Recombination protein N)
VEGAMERARRVDLLQFQVNEIEAARISEDEESGLTSERAMLANAERLTEASAEAHVLLAGGDEIEPGGGVSGPLGKASARLHEIAAIDESVAGLASKCDEIGFLLDDLVAEVRDYQERVEANPARLEEVDERIDLIKNLKRKYGATIADVIDFGERSARELEEITGEDSDLASLQANEAQIRTRLAAHAAALSEKRARAALTLSSAVEQSIAELNMGRSRFEVSVQHREDPKGLPVEGPGGVHRSVAYDETGIDRVEFLLAPNAGEALKPLARVASGGETARLMLALKSILAAADSTPTLVFDEVDVGVGGRSGQVVGEKLWALSGDHQVLVITHLAQIAAFAGTHFMIEKAEREDRTSSGVRALGQNERVDELAAMMDGLPPSDPSREAARELLARVARWKSGHAAGAAVVYSTS